MDFFDYFESLLMDNLSSPDKKTLDGTYLTDNEIENLLLGGAESLEYGNVLGKNPRVELELSFDENGTYFESPYDFTADIESYQKFNKARNANYRKSLKYKNTKKEKARSIEYSDFRPNIGRLTKRQLNWYLYWRTNFRRGNYLEISPDYIRIYASEIIDGIGWKDPFDGLKILYTLFENYSGKESRLDQNLFDWTMDFCIFYDLPFDVRPFLLSRDLYKKDLKINMYLMQLSTLNFQGADLKILESVLKYKFSKSVFYEKNSDIIDKVLKEVLSAVDDYYFETYEMGVLDFPFNTDWDNYAYYIAEPYHPLFSGSSSIYNNYSVEFECLNYNHSKKTIHNLEQIFKYTINALRKALKARGRLQKIELPEDLQRIIDEIVEETLPKQPSKKATSRPVRNKDFKLEIDLEAVDELTKDFELNKKRLYVSPVQEDEGLEKFLKVEPAPKSKKENNEDYLFDLGLLDGDLKDFMENLDLVKQKALKVILTSNDAFAEVKKIAKEEDTFLETLVDEINEVSYETIGDELIELSEDTLVCSEEYKEDLEETII